MIFMVRTWYPGDKAKEVIEMVKQAPKMPDFIKKWQMFGTADGSKGYKVYNLIFVEDKGADKAGIFIAKMMQHFTENVEGYNWKIELVMGMRDSMKALL